MKKAKFLALALAGAITLMGAGYAAWTDSVQIKNTVNTGYIDLSFKDLEGETEIISTDTLITGAVIYRSDEETNPGNKQESNDPITNLARQTNKDIAVVTINNMYPGSSVSCKLLLKNNSTIPIKITDGSNVMMQPEPSATGFTVTLNSVVYKMGDQILQTVNGTAVKDKIDVGVDIEFNYTFTAGADVNEEDVFVCNATYKYDQWTN